MKITVERSKFSGEDLLWSAFLGPKWEPGNPVGVGTTPDHAIGSLASSAHEALNLKLSGPAPELGDAKAVLGGIIRAHAEGWGIEIDIREGKDE